MRGALNKEIENGSKMSLDSGLSWIFVFAGGNKWRRAIVGPRGRGRALHPRGQVAAPPVVFSVPKILKYFGKKNHISFSGCLENFYFQGIWRTFIFVVFLYYTDNQITDRKIFIFILFNINNRK